MPPKTKINAIQIGSNYKGLFNRKIHKIKIKVQSKNTSRGNKNGSPSLKEFFKYRNMRNKKNIQRKRKYNL